MATEESQNTSLTQQILNQMLTDLTARAEFPDATMKKIEELANNGGLKKVQSVIAALR